MIEERDPDPRDERVRQLEAEMAELRSAMRRLTDSANGSHAPADASTSTRRGLLRLAGAAAIGAVGASMASSSPAAANNGIEPNNQDSQTIVTYTGAATVGNGISFISYPGGGNVTVGSAESRAAVAAWTAEPSGLRNGLHGWTNISTGAGVVAEHGAIAGTALKAIALPESGLGISASGQTAVAANGGQIAFQAAGPIGFYSAGNTRCAMWISPNAGGAPRTVPSTRTDAHQAGEIDFAAGSLWLCTASGTPGTWVSLGGASTGGFHPITPSRVYDSRGTGGPLAAGASRAVSVANAIDPASLQVSTPDIVPSPLKISRPAWANGVRSDAVSPAMMKPSRA